MAAANPDGPVSGSRCGRTMPSGRKRRSSRRSRGSSPARINDDLPAPDGPNTSSSDFTRSRRIPRRVSNAATSAASRPKNTPASTGSNGSHPRYGARSGSVGGGHTNASAEIPAPRIASRNRIRPSVANITGGPPPISILVCGPVSEQINALPLRRQVPTGAVFQPGAQDLLVEVFGGAVFHLAFPGGLPGRRQQADHRLTAGVRPRQRVLPAHPRSDPTAGIHVQEDFVDQRRILFGQPAFERHRRPHIGTGMTQEDSRHRGPPIQPAPRTTTRSPPPVIIARPISWATFVHPKSRQRARAPVRCLHSAALVALMRIARC